MLNFNRIISLLLLCVFLFTSCPAFVIPEIPPDKITIHNVPVGLGTPKYVFIDEYGNITDEDTGRTVLYIEDNVYTEGVFFLSDILNNKDGRVTLLDTVNNNAVTFFFKENKDFPYRLEIKTNDTVYYALFSQYRQSDCTYDIVFQHEGQAEVKLNLVLNSNIFSIYEEDIKLSADANWVLNNIVIASGLLGSIAYYLDNSVLYNARSFLKSFISGIRDVIVNVVRPVAAVVAVVGTGIAVCVNPAAAIPVAVISIVVFEATYWLEGVINTNFSGILNDNGGPGSTGGNHLLPVIVKYNHDPDKEFFNGEEFHIPRGGSIQLDICIPGFNRDDTWPIISYPHWYEPGVPLSSNKDLFNMKYEFYGNSDEFQIVYTRLLEGSGFLGDGKLSLGFQFGQDITINGNTQEVFFKIPVVEEEASLHKDLVFITFCINSSCPDYVD